MKHTTCFFAAVAATLCTVACNKDLPATTQLNTNPEAVQNQKSSSGH